MSTFVALDYQLECEPWSNVDVQLSVCVCVCRWHCPIVAMGHSLVGLPKPVNKVCLLRIA